MKLKILLVTSFVILVPLGTVFVADSAYARPIDADDGAVPKAPDSNNNFKCTILPESICKMNDQNNTTSPTSKNNSVLALLQWIIGILTAGVGIIAVGAFIYAGILYSSSNGNAEQVKRSKDVMMNTVIGILVFGAMALALQWLIPGGVF